MSENYESTAVDISRYPDLDTSEYKSIIKQHFTSYFRKGLNL
jgi:hypothetical protein